MRRQEKTHRLKRPKPSSLMALMAVSLIHTGLVAGLFLFNHQKTTAAGPTTTEVWVTLPVSSTQHLIAEKSPKEAVQENSKLPDAALAEPAKSIAETSPPKGDELSAGDAQTLAAYQPSFSGLSGTCDLKGAFSETFAQSPEVQYALSTLPQADRSVANAIMLWDGRWADDVSGSAMTLLRGLLTKTLLAAPPECLDALNQGPVMFLTPDRNGMAVLVVGSGEWRWAELMRPDPQFDEILLSAASKNPSTP